MRKSCIIQRKNSRLVVLHEDYIEICDGNMIAAMILSILIYWTDVKLAQREQEQEQRKATGEDIPLTSLWIWKSQEGFQHDLLVDKPGMRQVHRSTIATAISLLKEKKFVQARRNPHNNIDRTQQYLVEQDAINEAIKALPECTKFSTRMSEIVQSNVGNQSMDCTETDNGLPNFRQTIPENTTREYDTENTEQREREVAHATTRSSSSSQEISSENDDTERREVVKPPQRENTNEVKIPPAPDKSRTNKVVPERPKPTPPVQMPVSPEAQRILDDWVSIFKKRVVIDQRDIDAAEHLVPTGITREEMIQERSWLFSTDDPNKPWYRKIGVSLTDIDKKYTQWQSLQDAPPVKSPGKEESNEHRVSSFGTPGYNFADEFYPSEAEKKAYYAAHPPQEVKS